MIAFEAGEGCRLMLRIPFLRYLASVVSGKDVG